MFIGDQGVDSALHRRAMFALRNGHSRSFSIVSIGDMALLTEGKCSSNSKL
jgi:hypothetical protein